MVQLLAYLPPCRLGHSLLQMLTLNNISGCTESILGDLKAFKRRLIEYPSLVRNRPGGPLMGIIQNTRTDNFCNLPYSAF